MRKFSVRFESCDIVTEAIVMADSIENAVRTWENDAVSEYIKVNFGLFFTQPSYAEMCAAASAKDASLTVTEAA